jgi:hypothetical protein
VHVLQIFGTAMGHHSTRDGPVKEYYKVGDASKDQFAGDRINFPVWRRRFLATVHLSRTLILDKALALSMALDKNK